MEKLCYVCWEIREPRPTIAVQVRTRLRDTGIRSPTVHVTEPGAPAGSPAALVTFWIDCHDRREAAEAALAALADRRAGYLVTESVYIEDPDPPDAPSASRVALLEGPGDPDDDAWLTRWPASILPVLRETDIRRYVRNLVARAVTDDAPPYRVILEERWTSHHAASAPLDEHGPVVVDATEHVFAAAGGKPIR